MYIILICIYLYNFDNFKINNFTTSILKEIYLIFNKKSNQLFPLYIRY